MKKSISILSEKGTLKEKVEMKLSYLILGAIALSLSWSCTKPREAKLPDSVNTSTFSLSELGSNRLQTNLGKVKLGSTRMLVGGKDDEKLAVNQWSSYAVDVAGSSLPARIKYMFEGLAVSGQVGQEFSIAMVVDSSGLTCYRIVDSTESLPPIEKALALSKDQILRLQLLQSRLASERKSVANGDAAAAATVTPPAAQTPSQVVANTSYVPMFRLKVKGKGVLRKKRTATGEETSELELVPTDLKHSTHLQFDTNVENRIEFPFVDSSSDSDLVILYAENKIQKKVYSLADWSDIKKIVEMDKDANALIYSTFDETNKQIRFYRIRPVIAGMSVDVADPCSGLDLSKERPQLQVGTFGCTAPIAFAATYMNLQMSQTRFGELSDFAKLSVSTTKTEMIKIDFTSDIAPAVATPAASPTPSPTPSQPSSAPAASSGGTSAVGSLKGN